MAFTVPATSNNAGSVAGTTGLSITKPTGLQDDDVLYAVLARHDDIGGDFASTGWTALANNQTSVGQDMSSGVLRKVITDASSEAASYTFTHSSGTAFNMAGIIIIVRGADTTTPEDATITESTGANDDNPDSPTITTTTDGALVIPVCVLNNNQGGDVITFAAPSGYTLADSENSSYQAQCGMAYLAKASAGATGAITWLNTADSNLAEYHTYTIAVKPGEGGEPGGISIPVAMRHYRNLRTN